MKRVTVYCASSTRLPQSWYDAAEAIGKQLAEHDLELVYGGGSIGLMGACATGTKQAGGHVHGVITHKLVAMEQAWDGCDVLDVVDTMQQRRRKLLDLADGLLVLPGGLGTMEEFFEALVARQLGDHGTPIVLVNIDGALTSLIDMLNDLTQRQLIRDSIHSLYAVADDPSQAVQLLLNQDGGVVDPAGFVPSGEG
ncbi:MAG: TIGR00730 family Rossman fold protein [Phycisphaerales bacterium]|nr:TIGR00730 family Rossman fold protein [Phycisphaerales bacterium]